VVIFSSFSIRVSNQLIFLSPFPALELFHRINRIITQDQAVLTVAPTSKVRDAVALKRKHGYSQVTVVKNNGEVLGVFYFRSFAYDAAKITFNEISKPKFAPGDLLVDEYLDPTSSTFRRVCQNYRGKQFAIDFCRLLFESS